MSLPTNQRIRRPAEFRAVFARGRRSSNDFTNIVAVPNDLSYLRVGLAVSKRVGNAVTRNLLKRRIRSTFSNMSVSKGWDVVIIAKRRSSDVPFTELDRAIRITIERVGVRVNDDPSKQPRTVV
ncbi:MAG: ribonuclease P protein component [Chloroflexi bacterium]|nr:ribonuclease P protein component [Chloroflexota bacterium]MBT3862824.1 ribonuclease P protein component [Chloroflexota bacterium]MBT4143335.1 ribonuclease P protein component [Chloroflexota bacterium]MBT4340821.1 ribonuclease P protein component [Chloroflexota bacterium]MBT4944499.1 ribonuclease P protein component [Chloroflexota bacterium]